MIAGLLTTFPGAFRLLPTSCSLVLRLSVFAYSVQCPKLKMKDIFEYVIVASTLPSTTLFFYSLDFFLVFHWCLVFFIHPLVACSSSSSSSLLWRADRGVGYTYHIYKLTKPHSTNCNSYTKYRHTLKPPEKKVVKKYSTIFEHSGRLVVSWCFLVHLV